MLVRRSGGLQRGLPAIFVCWLAAAIVAPAAWGGGGGGDLRREIGDTVFGFGPAAVWRPTCVATRLAGKWVLTAGHCYDAGREEVHIFCRGRSDAPISTRVTIAESVRHEARDVVLLRLEPAPACGTAIARIADSIPDGARFVTPMVDQLGVSLPPSPLLEVSRDEYALRLRDEVACLGRGTSGSPFFIGDPSASPRLAAILVSGGPGCPAVQTAVRLDGIRAWIEETLAGADAD